MDNCNIWVRFAVMRGSGVKLTDVKPAGGKFQPYPSSHMVSKEWNSGCPTSHCSEEGCRNVVRWWCPVCIQAVTQGSDAVRNYPMKGPSKCYHALG